MENLDRIELHYKTLMNYNDRRVLVTGANGLLGAHLIFILQSLGAQVGAMTLDVHPDSFFAQQKAFSRIINFAVDLNDQQGIDRIMQLWEPEFVFHLGAVTQVQTGFQDPLQTFQTNVMGTVNVLESVRRLGGKTKGIALASSDKSYGVAEKLPYSEKTPLTAHGPYDTSKACTDLIGQSYAKTFNLPITILRAGNIFGPGDMNWSRIIPGTIKSLLKNEVPTLRSDGSPIRDFVYVRDVALGYLLANLNNLSANQHRIFNLSSNSPLTVREVYEQLCISTNGQFIEPRYELSVYPEIQEQILDSRLAFNVLGWKPTTTFEECLYPTIKWYRDLLK